MCLSQISFARPQSLAEAARREAERRKALDQQGIEAKVVRGDASGHGGDPSNSLSVPPSFKDAGAGGTAKGRASLQSLRTKLRKLDLDIQQGEERLRNFRARLESEKWQLPKVGKTYKGNAGTSASERIRIQIQELEAKLRRWTRERFEIYEIGRKAGYLPGELDGKGIVP